MFREAEVKADKETCKLVGEIFKRLISIDPKPDIILILVNNQNNKDFFTCLTYLEENNSLDFDIEDFIKNKAKFNNLLQIEWNFIIIP